MLLLIVVLQNAYTKIFKTYFSQVFLKFFIIKERYILLFFEFYIPKIQMIIIFYNFLDTIEQFFVLIQWELLYHIKIV